ncbi:AMP-binding protein [Amycolatopsis panacis]|uniref:2-aminobenzoate-CoA ligase n=1 Tax=Amycolatopsis panacis TaxID=2340917 RepID=A0A419HRY4_9PSEU|nr:AMP-binding protein [Amycolatopsis panacis]RJQ79355.1 2-aminobenzoate-CoA ligase [Amycolatopsis panacis]
MPLLPSAHVDTFCRDHLPPRAQWPRLRFELPELQYPDRLNAATRLVDDAVRHWGADRRAVSSPTDSWTYGELLARANQVAGELRALGVVPGNRVLLRGPNTPWLAACWLGVLKAGAVAVTTMPMLRAHELTEIVEACAPVLAVCDHRYPDELASFGFPVVAYGSVAADDLAARCQARPATFADMETSADDVAILAFTSGTTGRPKATMHFHRDLLAIADTFSRHVVRPEPADLFCGTPPLGFTFGLGGLLVFPLRAGAATLLIERATPLELADLVADHGVTVLFTAPTAYRAILASDRRPLLRGLRRAVSAGEALPASVATDFHEATGRRLIDGIGSTEMLHVFISAADEDARPGATGRAVPGYHARIVDDQGHPVPDGTPGRLAVQGPTGCRYLADDRQTVFVEDGWNLTGDTYVRDSDGYFHYRARSDDMIVSSGYNIAGPEVEEVLLHHPDVLECAVVAAPDEARGSVVAAYVVLAEGAEAGPAKVTELQDFAKSLAAPYKYPRRVEFVPELPRNPSGKVQRYLLRRRAAESSL